MYPGTKFYGIGKILLEYARLPRWLPLPVAVQHGWLRQPTRFEVAANPPEIWVWSRRTAQELAAMYPASRIRVTASFFCYLQAMRKKPAENEHRKGSVCIPPHSSHFTRAEYAVADFARLLNELDERYKPVTVMLYFLDMQPETVAEYRKYGFSVVSNGSLYDTAFLDNFLHHVSGRQYCLFSDLGSGVLFASALGLELVRMDMGTHYSSAGDNNITASMLQNMRQYDDGFMRGLDEGLLAAELGTAFILSPHALRWAILRNYASFRFWKDAVRRMAGTLLRKFGW